LDRTKIPLKNLWEKIIGMGRLATNINVIFCLLSGLKAEQWSFPTDHRTTFCKTIAHHNGTGQQTQFFLSPTRLPC
jgi:hypothetical protein